MEWITTHNICVVDAELKDRKRFEDEAHALDEIVKDELPVRLDLFRGEAHFVDQPHLL